MRIEILVEGSIEPQIYPIDKPKMTLGSGETCDVVISSDNISRKHLMIIQEGDAYFVVDQGSTNGSYINEERLVPGRRTEFTSFFPVRLGDHVLITLLSDVDAQESAGDGEPLIPLIPKEPTSPSIKRAAPARGADESTKMISLADLKKAKTSDLQAKREKVIAKRKAPPAKRAPVKTKRTMENEKFKIRSVLILAIVGAVAYYNISEKKEESTTVSKMGEIVQEDPLKAAKPVEAVPVQAPQSEAKLIPDDQLLDKPRYLQLLGDAKCITEMEKYFCDLIPGASGDRFGVVQIGTTIHIMIDGDPFIKEARGIVRHPVADESGNYPPEVYELYKQAVMNTAIALFFMKTWPKELDEEKVKDLKIFLALFEIWEGTTYIQRVAAGYPDMIKKYQGFVNRVHINNVKEVGDSALEFTKRYYKTY